ncbi:hypothetical protein A2V71_04270 [Candidatus Berkelbacteria bacterium RBG_13_40_8]|uniref:Type II secretion system protein GspG C-terminal domain-containing protein n=1 Tax=Candidatus Berkelbacteria bacterium RBG_13_40_8 TaxID=1797467 RepID=A0A1F5DNI3_9BACT|nr:MAG: hypothetical protein A2V71_04270 [Candidatus Berkelbacteria bacterium RBG_13_40_8]
MKKGFNLIELLISISIIALLTGIIVVGLADARKKGRDSSRIADINSVASALANYYADKHAYPSGDYSAMTNVLTDSSEKYLGSVPQDPKNQSPYVYGYLLPTPGEYNLTACLEKNGGSTGSGDATICNSGPYYRLINGEPSG